MKLLLSLNANETTHFGRLHIKVIIHVSTSQWESTTWNEFNFTSNEVSVILDFKAVFCFFEKVEIQIIKIHRLINW